MQRARKENGQYISIDSPENTFDNALKKIDGINLTIEGSSSRCYLSETGLIFKNPMSYHCSARLHQGAAYCEGPLLFPAPLNQTICITIDIDYTGTLKSKTFTLKNITLERNKMYLFTLWILNENIDISISPDAELNLEELKFNSQVAGNDGFWN